MLLQSDKYFLVLFLLKAVIDTDFCIKQLELDRRLCLETPKINWAVHWGPLGHLEPLHLTVELAV